jgi:hypothetical protein
VIVGMDDCLNGANSGMSGKGCQGMAQDRLPVQEAVLFGQRAAKAAAAPGRNDENCNG